MDGDRRGIVRRQENLSTEPSVVRGNRGGHNAYGVENPEGGFKGCRLVGDLSRQGEPKTPEWRDGPGGTKPADWPPRATDCQVETGQVRE